MNLLKRLILAALILVSIFSNFANAGIRHIEQDGNHYLKFFEDEDDQGSEAAVIEFLEDTQGEEAPLLSRKWRGTFSREEKVLLIRKELFGTLGRKLVTSEEVNAFLESREAYRNSSGWGKKIRPVAAGVLLLGVYCGAQYCMSLAEDKLSAVPWLAQALAGLFGAVTYSVVNSVVQPSTAVLGQMSYKLSGSENPDISSTAQKQLAEFYNSQFWRTNKAMSWVKEAGRDTLVRMQVLINTSVSGIASDFQIRFQSNALILNQDDESPDQWLLRRFAHLLTTYKVFYSLDVPLLPIINQMVSERLSIYRRYFPNVESVKLGLLPLIKEQEAALLQKSNEEFLLDDAYYFKMIDAWISPVFSAR